MQWRESCKQVRHCLELDSSIYFYTYYANYIPVNASKWKAIPLVVTLKTFNLEKILQFDSLKHIKFAVKDDDGLFMTLWPL